MGLVVSGADGSVEGDRAEARALVTALGASAATTPVTAPSGALGDPVDAKGLVGAAVAIGAMRSGIAPPIPRLAEPEVPGLRYLAAASPIDARHALVTATSNSGGASAVVLSRPA